MEVGTIGDHPNYIIVENGQNTEKSPRDLKRLAVTQRILANADMKNSRRVNNNNNNKPFEMKEKNEKRIFQENEKATRDQTK